VGQLWGGGLMGEYIYMLMGEYISILVKKEEYTAKKL